MEDCCVAANADIIDCSSGIDVGPTLQEHSGRCEVSVFRGHMQERSSLKREAAPAGHAAIEFREALVNECGISVNLLSQTIEPAAEQLQHGGRVVLGRTTGLEKDVYAGAQSLCGTRVR